jgi:hypothetical protein
VSFLIAILIVVIVGLVVLVVGAPLHRARQIWDSAPDAGHAPEVKQAPALPARHTSEELESAREAKYREIRDAEMDFRTGKLSREDYEAVDAELRAEAIEILNRVEESRLDLNEAEHDGIAQPDAVAEHDGPVDPDAVADPGESRAGP